VKFFVQIEGEAQNPCSTADAAIAFAKTRLYLSPAEEERVRSELRKGQIAKWTYGFKHAQIIVRQEDD
jgi:hypothetical protein